MPIQIPDYLRVHTDDHVAGSPAGHQDDMSDFWQAYVDATGWRINASASGRPSRPHLLPAAISDLEDQLPAVPKSAAQKLADAATQIADRIKAYESTIQKAEALHAVEDVRGAAATSDNVVADRLQEILETACCATRCDAAGLYLLDDDTSLLKLRSCYGLPPQRLADEPRPLRGALGDLEALVSTVVTIEDIASMTHWESPEQRGAAIVVAVNSGDLPLGTLWLWDDNARDISTAQQSAAKLAAGQIAAELKLEIAHDKKAAESSGLVELRDAAAWQHRQMPSPVPLAKGWDVAGWTGAAHDVSGQWFSWDILPDGSIAVAISAADAKGLESALIAATARSAWQAHAGYRHSTNQLLSRVNDTLWQTSTGEQLNNIVYASIDPESGDGHFASAGSCHTFIVNRYGYRVVSSPTSPLGSEPDQRIAANSVRLLPGDAMVMLSSDCLASNDRPESDRLSQQQLTDLIRDELAAGPEAALAALRRRFAESGDHDRSIVILQRS